MTLNPEKIRKNLKNPVELRIYRTLDSTNNEAKRLAADDAGSIVLYAADQQTAGRGRRGHSFWSPPTGLYMTLSLPVSGTAGVQPITCAAAVAVCDALTALGAPTPSVKWVNDIFIEGKKVAGILSELITDAANRPIAVIVGIGVNLTTTDFPADCAATAGAAGDLDSGRLCAMITDALIGMYHEADNNSVIEKYKKLNLCLGRTIRYTDRDGSHTAQAVDIAPDGSLIIEENGIRKSLCSGEISVTLAEYP